MEAYRTSCLQGLTFFEDSIIAPHLLSFFEYSLVQPKELDIVENFSLLLDTELSESLLMERLSRELVSYIQKERKNQGLDVTDRIKLTISSEDEFVHETITNFSKYITNETLTLDLITKKESSVNKVYDRFLDIFIERSTNNS